MSRKIKTGRILLIAALTLFFAVCLLIMPVNYDPLAHYPYATDANHDRILALLDQDEIAYIIDNQTPPDRFLPYAEFEGFNIYDCEKYVHVRSLCGCGYEQAVQYVNAASGKTSSSDLYLYLSAYPVDMLTEWYTEDHNGEVLVSDPQDPGLRLDRTMTLYRYEPADLTEFSTSMIAKAHEDKAVLLTADAAERIDLLLKIYALMGQDDISALEELTIECGYLSYEEQLSAGSEYHKAGHNMEQTGRALRFNMAEGKMVKDNVFYKWLEENSYRFDFRVEAHDQQGFLLIATTQADAMADRGGKE